MEYFSKKYGLVTDNDPVSENGQLFLAHLLLFPDGFGNAGTMLKQLKNSKVEEGLYHRNPDLVDRRIMSHDNMSGIMSFSYEFQTTHRFEIWKYLIRHLGTYDNSKGKSKQLSRFLPFNPANFFPWGLCAQSKLAYLFLIFYIPSLIISCNRKKEDTSGKILAWIELFPHRTNNVAKHLFRYYERKMKAMYGEEYMKELVAIYHGRNNTKEFPLNKIFGVGQ